MRSGTIPRRKLRQRQHAGRPPSYAPLLGLLVLGVMVLLWVAGRFSLDSGAAVAVASPTIGPTLTAGSARPTTALPTPTATRPTTPSPTATPSPTPPPTPTPTPSPTPTQTPSPSPTPTASPSPSPSPMPAPTAPPVGLVILAPADGAIVGQRQLVISGLTRPGSPITWDRPLWFDDHTTADGLGNWSFTVALAEGENAFTFRVGDDMSTAQTINVRYQP